VHAEYGFLNPEVPPPFLNLATGLKGTLVFLMLNKFASAYSSVLVRISGKKKKEREREL